MVWSGGSDLHVLGLPSLLEEEVQARLSILQRPVPSILPLRHGREGGGWEEGRRERGKERGGGKSEGGRREGGRRKREKREQVLLFSEVAA